MEDKAKLTEEQNECVGDVVERYPKIPCMNCESENIEEV